ncbi:MAG: YihY/virulence factor BrkB family protein [Pyrinomonadaceae bacterium]|nr:YihY/virulence factor BrkB family protein [Pyrinomonadaceae bacterium]
MSSQKSLWKFGGLSWLDLGKRVYTEIIDDDVFGSAAQLAYYFLFALFPALIVLTSVFGFLVGADTKLRDSLFLYFGTVLPSSAAELVRTVVTDVSEASSGGKITLGLLLALWAASGGFDALMQNINKAYNVKETRPFWKRRLMALGLTTVLAILILSALIVVLFGGQIVDWVAASYGFGDFFRTGWKIGQWIIVLSFVLLAFALIYYWSPDVKDQKWFFITPGSIIAVALWLLVSFGFRAYLQYFDTYSKTYGSLGAVIVLMLWLYITSVAILVGGNINSEIESAAAEQGDEDAKPKGEKVSNKELEKDNQNSDGNTSKKSFSQSS